MSDTFYELLISSVKNTRVLWDIKHKHYHNSLLVDREWTRIAADLQETKEVVKNKWKNLRDRFKKELNKIPKYRSGDDAENASQYNSTWSHFESMLFLRYILTPKATEGNIEDSGSTSHAQECETEIKPSETSFDKEPDDDELSLPSKKKDTPINPIVIQRKRKAPAKNEGNLDEEFLRLEAKKVALLEKKEADNEDINFFKSLLPHVRELPSLNKLSFRSQVQNLLPAEIWKVQNNRNHYNANFASSSSYQQPSHPSSAPSPAASTTTCFSAPISPAENLQASGYQQYTGIQNDDFV